MTPEQKAAFINAQTALFNAKIQEMLAANREREDQGYAPAYGESAFDELITEYEPIIGYNAVLALFREWEQEAQ